MTEREAREIKLECLRLAGGNITTAEWMYKFVVGDAAEMTELEKNLREDS